MVAIHLLAFYCLMYFDSALSVLWPKGIVHYAINNKDYDVHTQDLIVSAFDTVAKELCVKFFNTPSNSATVADKILFISNPNKQKNCPPEQYNYTGTVVDMTIGYKCLNKKDIARIAVDMLKASIDQTAPIVNSYDLVKLFEEQEQSKPRSTFLKTEDRNYINSHYRAECSALAARAPSRRAGGEQFPPSELTPANERYYEQKLWPLGVVMYSVEDGLRDSADYKRLMHAMAQIELASCVVFHEIGSSEKLTPKSLLVFQNGSGEDFPKLGVQRGEQRLNLASMVRGAPGHSAHTLNCLLRALGLHMMSNRFDRDNYLAIHWQYVRNESAALGSSLLSLVNPPLRPLLDIGHPQDSPPRPILSHSHPPNSRNPLQIVAHLVGGYTLTDSSSSGHEYILEKAPREAWVEAMPYDFASATHAPANFLCGDCRPGAHTVVPLQDFLWQRTVLMGHRAALSEPDRRLVALLYGKQCNNRFKTR